MNFSSNNVSLKSAMKRAQEEDVMQFNLLISWPPVWL
jgi:hypothetical protein